MLWTLSLSVTFHASIWPRPPVFLAHCACGWNNYIVLVTLLALFTAQVLCHPWNHALYCIVCDTMLHYGHHWNSWWSTMCHHSQVTIVSLDGPYNDRSGRFARCKKTLNLYLLERVTTHQSSIERITTHHASVEWVTKPWNITN